MQILLLSLYANHILMIGDLSDNLFLFSRIVFLEIKTHFLRFILDFAFQTARLLHCQTEMFSFLTVHGSDRLLLLHAKTNFTPMAPVRRVSHLSVYKIKRGVCLHQVVFPKVSSQAVIKVSKKYFNIWKQISIMYFFKQSYVLKGTNKYTFMIIV
jgi:hypothetical protein